MLDKARQVTAENEAKRNEEHQIGHQREKAREAKILWEINMILWVCISAAAFFAGGIIVGAIVFFTYGIVQYYFYLNYKKKKVSIKDLASPYAVEVSAKHN
jgi:hypothetical protein